MPSKVLVYNQNYTSEDYPIITSMARFHRTKSTNFNKV